MFARLGFLGPFGMGEVALVLVIGLLLFGRKLPEVGRQVGRTVADLRRGLQGFKDELEKDEDFRAARDAFDDAKRGVRETRRIADPRRLLEEDTKSTPRAAGPDDAASDSRSKRPDDAAAANERGDDAG